MSPRVVSPNYKLEIDGKIVFPKEIPEFSLGEEGMIDVADGDVKYKIKDGIKVIAEFPVTFYTKKNDTSETDIMDAWVESGESKDVSLIGEDSGGSVIREYAILECECCYAKISGSDRASKAESTQGYTLLPKDIREIKS